MRIEIDVKSRSIQRRSAGGYQSLDFTSLASTSSLNSSHPAAEANALVLIRATSERKI